MTAISSVLDHLKRGLREPRIYLLALIALLLWSAAYQYKRDYSVEVADRVYQPYISNFNEPETSVTDPPFMYRWSKGSPSIRFPGIGNQPIQVDIVTIGGRPNAAPPKITWTARGQTFEIQTQPGEHTDTFFLDRGPDKLDADLRLDFQVPTFTDPRELGVIILRVIVHPADYGFRPIVIPPISTLLALLAALFGVYLLFLISGVRRSFGLLASALITILAAIGILAARPDTALFAEQLPTLMLWGLLLALLAHIAFASFTPHSQAVAWGILAFVAAFLLRFGGLTYPQFLTSDIILHVHNAQDVLKGNWVFTEPLPDGRLVPYPPAYYLLIAVLSPFTGASDAGLSLALKWSASLLDSLTCLALAWAVSRLWSRFGFLIGAFAAWAYVASPGVFDLFSAGNYTNLFGQSIQNLTLLGVVVYLTGKGSTRFGAVLLGIGFFLTMLGHYGMMLATIGVLVIFLVLSLIYLRRSPQYARAWSILASAMLALLAAVAAYYWRFLDIILGQFADVFGKLLGNTPTAPSTEPPTEKPGLLDGILKLPAKLAQLSGALLVISAISGFLLLPKRLLPPKVLLASWLLAALAFALLDRVIGDSVRWYYLAAAPLALLTGRFLASLGMRRGWPNKLAILVVALALLQMLRFWLDLIYQRYH